MSSSGSGDDGGDGRSDLFSVLAALLNPAVAGLAALGVAGMWGDEHWFAVATLAVLQIVGSFILSARFSPSNGLHAVRIVSGYNWAVLGAIMFLTGGYPSPFWVFGLIGAIAHGTMMDRPGIRANTLAVLVTMAVPRIPTGIDLATAVGIGMATLVVHVIGLAALASAKLLVREQLKQRDAEVALREANVQLTGSITRLEERDRELASITSMGRLLQSTATRDELCGVLASYMRELFPGESGAIYVYSASRNELEAAVTWGALPAGDQGRLFAPDECWALRQGQVYRQDAARAGLHCQHVHELSAGYYLCEPLMARGETLGVLHLRVQEPTTARPSYRSPEQVLSLVESLSEYVSLALANLALRETLRNQAIRDPLTGLFNRRFAEETLERELFRAARNQTPLSLIFLDVDHFKVFNDTYGHEAGDLVLQQLGACVREHLRGEDVACRFGGEEFLIVLSDTPIETAAARADLFREQFKGRQIKFGSQYLGTVTLSAGVAAFPADGDARDAIIAAADRALYRAKANGRDCVVLAGDGQHRGES